MPDAIAPSSAVRRLDEGNARFVSGALEHPRRDDRHRAALARGQQPYAVVLGCSDSRVPPEIVFDEGLGDLFAVRVAGNTAHDPIVLGSVEFAVAALGVAAVVVLGHQDCGAVQAALDLVRGGPEPTGDLMAVVGPIVPVVESVLASTRAGLYDRHLLDACIHANVTRTVEDLARVPSIARAIAEDAVVIAGREYRLATGEAVTV